MCLSFSVAAIVHEDDLLCTHASPSPLHTFQDWHPVLLFIEDTVTNLWTIFLRSVKAGAELRVAKLHLKFLPCCQRNCLESAVRREIQSSPDTLWGSASEKHDPGSRFQRQIGS